MFKPLLIRCDIHGDIKVSKHASAIIGHQLFQRLRYIHQNGLLYLVYPGMRHSRFEHSLGAYHLSKLWLFELMENLNTVGEFQNKVLPITDDFEVPDSKQRVKSIMFSKTLRILRDLKGENKDWFNYITVAALTHDLGHGPLSHTFEKCHLISKNGYMSYVDNPDIDEYISQLKEVEHEDLSIIFIDKIIKDQFKERLAQENDREVTIVSCLINEGFMDFAFENSSLLNEEDKLRICLFKPIISGLFDVDRLDYMVRDSRNAGVSCGNIDIQRIIKSVIPVLMQKKDGKFVGGMVVKSRMINILDHMLISLYEMYAMIYHHPDLEAIQQQLITLVEKLQTSGRIAHYSVGQIANLTDAEFIRVLNIKSEKLLGRVLNRQSGNTEVIEYRGTVPRVPKGFNEVVVNRRMIKGELELFFIQKMENNQFDVRSSFDISLVKQFLSNAIYTSTIYWKNVAFQKHLKSIKVKKVA